MPRLRFKNAPPLPELKTVTVDLELDHIDLLRNQAIMTGVPFAVLVRRALARDIAKMQAELGLDKLPGQGGE